MQEPKNKDAFTVNLDGLTSDTPVLSLTFKNKFDFT